MDSDDEVPGERCGFVLEPGDVPGDAADDYEAGSEEWYEYSDAACCWREVWDGGDGDRCIWHAETDDKPADGLVAARADGPERLDGAYVPAVELGDAIDFEDCRLWAATFDGTGLREASFAGVDGWFAQFPDAYLEGAQFPDADLWAAQFTDADFRQAEFPDAFLLEAQFLDADLRKAEFPDASLPRAQFSDVNLEAAQFPDAYLPEVQFPAADLYEARFPNADLREAQFPEAGLSKAQFPDADLEAAQFPNADLREAQFTDAYLEAAQFPNADLREAQFPDADLRWAQFPDAYLEGAQFSSANLQYAQFTDADLRHAEFPDAFLLDAQFPDADLQHAQFTDADLEAVQFTDATLTDANISGAEVHGADFEGAELTRVNLFDSDLRETELYGASIDNVSINRRTKFGGHYGTTVAGRAPTRPKLIFVLGRVWWWEWWGWFRRWSVIGHEIRLALGAGSPDPDNQNRLEKAGWSLRRVEQLSDDAGLSKQSRSYNVQRKDVERRLYLVEDGPRWRWAMAMLSSLSMRYGQSPWRVVGLSVVAIVAAATGYMWQGLRLTGGGASQVIGGGADAVPLATLVGKSLYFSTITFTTVGYGDIQPVGWSQTIATAESFLGALLMALLVYVLGRRATW